MIGWILYACAMGGFNGVCGVFSRRKRKGIHTDTIVGGLFHNNEHPEIFFRCTIKWIPAKRLVSGRNGGGIELALYYRLREVVMYHTDVRCQTGFRCLCSADSSPAMISAASPNAVILVTRRRRDTTPASPYNYSATSSQILNTTLHIGSIDDIKISSISSTRRTRRSRPAYHSVSTAFREGQNQEEEAVQT